MTTPHITIQTDRGPMALAPNSTLDLALPHLLAGTPTRPEQIATAVNGQFVARADRDRYVLQDGDTVLCFSPITGG